ncbi:hypothetical protein F5B19DRAFT_473843 [Rostrohypoxylon terebratum]|nr:hypothetical protein F5B19DRAFT_473843 [Rostrohypoxylon terebratum]
MSRKWNNVILAFRYYLCANILAQIKMAFLGIVTNRTTSGGVTVSFTVSRSEVILVQDLIDPQQQNTAYQIVKEHFESGYMFNETEMRLISRLHVRSIKIHTSEIDDNPHYSVVGETVGGIQVGEAQVPEDTSRKT